MGALLVEGVPRFVTLEPPWKDNQKNVSCIPGGQYTAKRYHSQRYGSTFEVKNVPNRSAILFHAGNYGKDTEGCILVGYSFGEYGSIKDSARAMLALRGLLQGISEFDLIISHSPSSVS